jgi:3-oxoacyl-[acyl-carrier protein] reductase
MDLGLANKKVLITGSSRGIGLAIAKLFLEEGAIVCMTSRGSNDLFNNERKCLCQYL